jgi:membrane protein insertase Oxa1/YidC/SpoIIIJ
LQLKDSWATFWAMQKAEWDLIWSSVNSLKWTTKKDTFQTTLQWIIDKYEQELNKIAPEYMAQQWGWVSDITKQYRPWVQTIDSITGAWSNQWFDLSWTILNIANM